MRNRFQLTSGLAIIAIGAALLFTVATASANTATDIRANCSTVSVDLEFFPEGSSTITFDGTVNGVAFTRTATLTGSSGTVSADIGALTNNPNNQPTEVVVQASWTVAGGDSSDEVTFNGVCAEQPVLPASISLVKTPSIVSGSPGDVVTYTFEVTNTGSVRLVDIVLTDDKLGNITLEETELDPGQSTTGTATYTLQDSDVGLDVVNVATVTGQPPVGPAVEAVDEATVAVVQVGGNVEANGPGGGAQVLGATLPRTGSPSAILFKSALGLLVLGGLLTVIVRRRRGTAEA